MEGSSQVQPKRRLNKILLTGEVGVGKESLALAYLGPDKNESTWRRDWRNEICSFHIDGTDVETTLDAVKSCDCAGYGDPSWIHDQWAHYPNTSVVLICIDAGDYTPNGKNSQICCAWHSVMAAKGRWAEEMYYFCGSGRVTGWSVEKRRKGIAEDIRAASLKSLAGRKMPFLVVGCKIDLRDSRRGLSFEEGKKIASDIGAEAYLECSATTGKGVKEVFEEAARLALEFADSEPVEKTKSWWRGLGNVFGRLRWSG